MSSTVCYNEAKRSSKNPEEFGKDRVRGLAAAESGNNSCNGWFVGSTW
ncbi:hypothetical protein O9993_18165 [Vibrio lentus]|nr:hypothetical protein [Vibrio lentus]